MEFGEDDRKEGRRGQIFDEEGKKDGGSREGENCVGFPREKGEGRRENGKGNGIFISPWNCPLRPKIETKKKVETGIRSHSCRCGGKRPNLVGGVLR